jgi:L-cysteine S-thiosulfotransferase
MKAWRLFFLVFLPALASADSRTSGSVFLSPQLQALQNDPQGNPTLLWQERGQALWQTQCLTCHGSIVQMKQTAASFPRLSSDGKKIHSLEDQIAICAQRPTTRVASGAQAVTAINQDDVLSLSAALHLAAKGQPIAVNAAGLSAEKAAQWQQRLGQGRSLYETRMGNMNLACMHCHDQKVGAQMRADIISQGHPTGFPIYRMSWQTMGTLERRLRACYSGVQAPLPELGSAQLRDLELFMKVRANGMPMEGPSIRR